MKEIDIKRNFRNLWDGWCCSYEFGIGGDSGAPDLQVLVGKAPALLPIELKRGVMQSGGIVLPEIVRPAQIRWHREFKEAGGRSILLIGVTDTEFYLVDGISSSSWMSGFQIGKEAWKLWPHHNSTLQIELVKLLGSLHMFRRSEL